MNAVSKLRAVVPKTAPPSKAKILIFGKPGVGKTWQAIDFPSCYYIDTEGGANLAHYTEKLEASGGMYLGPDRGANDFSVVLEQVQALATEKHSFRTLVLDSASHLFNTEIGSEQERMIKAGTKDEYGASRKPAVSQMRRLVLWLDRLDMNVILIAHAKDEYGLNEKKERVVIDTTFDCWDKLEYILHLALHITKQGPSRYARVRKTRLLGFPDGSVFPWTYPDFAERYGREIIEKEAGQIILASAEQVAELNRLLEVVKMPDGWLEKCLDRAKAERLADLETDKIDKLIDAVKEKLP
jgi:hypothetical protein